MFWGTFLKSPLFLKEVKSQMKCCAKVSVKVEMEDRDPLFDTTKRAGTSLTGEVVVFSLSGEFSSGTSLSGKSFVFLVEGGPSSAGSNL